MAYQIFTDSSAGLEEEELRKLGIECLTIGLTIADKNYPDETGYMPDIDDFYGLQEEKDGKTTTAGVTIFQFMIAFRPVLEAGNDVLYLGITPEMSDCTRNSLNTAVEELKEEYPERRIEAPNTHAIAGGLGLLVTKMVELQCLGADLDTMLKEVAYWSERVAHWFSVDDLTQLKKSGRVTNVAAIVAGMLNIKPVMRLPYTGKLESVGKVRGRKALLKELAKIVDDTIMEPDGEIWLCYGGEIGREWVEALEGLIKTYCPDTRVSLHRINEIIGAHTGKTVIAVFFFANER